MLSLPDALYPRTRERLLAWAADPEVEGVVWVGSKSRGHGDQFSDDDLDVLLTPAAFARVDPTDSFVMERDPVAVPPRLTYDAKLTSLAELRAKTGSHADIDHWPYEQAPVLFDRDGEVAKAVQAAAHLPPAFRTARIQHGALDVVLAVARAKKTVMRNLPASTHLLVARGAKALTRVLFALEHRWAPLDHWLEPELASLADPHAAGALLIEALTQGRYEPLQEALTRLQPLLEREGVPEPTGYGRLQMEIMHPARAAERAIHGLD